MRRSSNRFSFLGLILIVAVLGLFAWLALMVILWNVLDNSGQAPDFWAMTESLSTAVGIAAILVAGFVAYRELSEVAHTRHMEVADRLFDELNAPEKIEARRIVFENLLGSPEEAISNLTDEEQRAIKTVLNSLDRVAFLTQDGWIPDHLIMPWMNPMIVKAWAKLGPFVEFERGRRGEPDYYESAQEVAERCIAWRKKKYGDAEVTWIDDAL